MPRLTREEAVAGFNHLLTQVLRKADTTPIAKALHNEGIGSILDFVTLKDEHIDALTYHDDEQRERFLLRGDRNLLGLAVRYLQDLRRNGHDYADFLSWTSEEFDEFRLNTSTGLSTNIGGPVTNPSASSPAPSASRYTPVEIFKRGIKRDPSLFPTLKDDRQHDVWHRQLNIQAHAQDVARVLDHTFTPSNPDDEALFKEQNKYMYAVLSDVVRTDKGKSIIRKYADKLDAQLAYHELKDFHDHSTTAKIQSSDILSWIVSARVGDGSWKGTTSSFLIYWTNQVRIYESQIDPKEHLSSSQKRTILENAVHDIEELRSVKQRAELDRVLHGKELTYESYYNLLESAAQAYDIAHSTKKRVKRQVLHHDMVDTDDHSTTYDYDSDFERDIGLDTPLSVLQAYSTSRKSTPARTTKPPNSTASVRLPKEAWEGLDKEARDLWNKFSPKQKALILGQKPSQYSANLHDMAIKDFLNVFSHEVLSDTEEPNDTPQAEEEHDDEVQNEDPDTDLLVNSTKTQHVKPQDIHRILSSSKKSSKAPKRSAKMHELSNPIYRVSASNRGKAMSLIDRGANGGVAGSDVRTINILPDRSVDIQGIDNHQLQNIKIGTVGGVVSTHLGNVILIMPQYAIYGKGTTIHSPGQIEMYKHTVDDKSVKVGGSQCITTHEGYVIPLIIKNGLAKLPMRPYTDDEWEELPHIFLTSQSTWDPSCLDHEHDLSSAWYSEPSVVPTDYDDQGNYLHRVNQLHRVAATSESTTRTLAYKKPAPENLRPYFGWAPIGTIKKTLDLTTQYGHLSQGTHLKQFFKSPNPALNVHRRNEPLACDIIYSDTPALSGGQSSAVIFVGLHTYVTDVFGLKRDKQFINTLEDVIRFRGAPTKLISDRAQVEISEKVTNLLRTLFIPSWQSEPYHQHQNFAERRIQDLKRMCNTILDRTGAPPSLWLHCLKYVAFLLNHTYHQAIDNVPLNLLTGSTVDISVLLRFCFWDQVYFKLYDNDFPSSTKEGIGRIVGISEHVGHALTWQVLNDETQEVIHRSRVRPVSITDPNLRAGPTSGELSESPNVVKTRHEHVKFQTSSSSPDNQDQDQDQEEKQARKGKENQDTPENEANPPPIIDAEDLIGRTFLLDTQEDGQRHRARVVEMVEDHMANHEQDPGLTQFKISVGDDQFEEVITYNQLLDYIEKDPHKNIYWKFKRITAHQGPLNDKHPDYMGSKYNVMVEWENGEITSEPLSTIAADDPVTCAIYAKENGLLEQDGWKRFKSIAKREKKFLRMVNQAKLRSYRHSPKYKYGFEVARSYNHAMELDRRNGNTKWGEAVTYEIDMFHENDVFKVHGHSSKVDPPEGYKKIRMHFVFDIKHDGRHRARLVADGNLTEVPLESVYSGVVSLRGFRLVAFLAELNDLEFWATDIGSAYLQALTSEKVYIVAGPEWGDLEGYILIMHKAAYGLRTSGARWHETFAECMHELGFKACIAEPDIWMRKNTKLNVYEYVAVYVDDLAMAMENPQDFVDKLTSDKYKFKVKGTGPIEFHLGMNFHRDEDGVLCMSPKKYIDKLLDNFNRLFGKAPKQNISSPLEAGDHPELDTSDLLDEKGIKIYQSLIGGLQWLITLGRFDIQTHVMTMSSFRAAPRQGHLDRLKRIFGYVAKMKHAMIRIRTEEPDYSDLPDPQYDWSKSVYGDQEELIPKDIPEPLGKYVTLTHFLDANLMHDMSTGKSVTGVLHLINKTPIDWYSKKQSTVETATYGSEFVAARTCVEQIIDLRTTLRYLGVPIRGHSYMFGDNQSVVNSSSHPVAKLNKRHTMLSFHRVRAAVASGMLKFHFIDGKDNPADILSKHWSYNDIWRLMKPILFWQGDTMNILDEVISPPNGE